MIDFIGADTVASIFRKFEDLARESDTSIDLGFVKDTVASEVSCILFMATGEDMQDKGGFWNTEQVQRHAAKARWPVFWQFQESYGDISKCQSEERFQQLLEIAKVLLSTCAEEGIELEFYLTDRNENKYSNS